MHAAIISRTSLRISAIKTTFGDDDNMKPNRQYQNNIVRLNNLFYAKPKTLTGKELKKIMHNKFGPRHALKIDTKHLTITDGDDEIDNTEYNLIANTINEFTIDPENVKYKIIESKIIYSGGKYIIQIPLQ